MARPPAAEGCRFRSRTPRALAKTASAQRALTRCRTRAEHSTVLTLPTLRKTLHKGQAFPHRLFPCKQPRGEREAEGSRAPPRVTAEPVPVAPVHCLLVSCDVTYVLGKPWPAPAHRSPSRKDGAGYKQLKWDTFAGSEGTGPTEQHVSKPWISGSKNAPARGIGLVLGDQWGAP